MINVLRIAATIGGTAGIAAWAYWLAGGLVRRRFDRSALAGLAAAAALTAWVATARHAALIRQAALTSRTSHPLSAHDLLASGFIGTAVVATAAVYVTSTVLGGMRSRRSAPVGSARHADPVRRAATRP